MDGASFATARGTELSTKVVFFGKIFSVLRLYLLEVYLCENIGRSDLFDTELYELT